VSEIKTVATNRKAQYEYFIEETFEVGLVLTGTEIKSVRTAQVSLKEGYILLREGELWLINVHIAPYEEAGQWTHDPKRTRKLLMHRREINRLSSIVQQPGYTLIPLRLYLKGKRAKLEMGLARGKHQHDKRETIAKRDEDRRLRREWREFERG